MKRHRRRGYALLYVLAALPLIAVVAMLTVRMLHQALTMQGLLIKQVANDTAMSTLVARIESDATTAPTIRAEVDADGAALTLIGPQPPIVYTVTNQTVSRTASPDDEGIPPESWDFRDANIRFQIEEPAAGEQIAWILFEFERTSGDRVVHRRKLAAAVHVHSGELQ